MNRFFEFSRPQMVTLAVLAIAAVLLGCYHVLAHYIISPDEVMHRWSLETLDNYQPLLMVNLNTAPGDSLELVPGLGPVLAARIVTYRNEHGPFTCIDSIVSVPGIGAAKLEKIRNYLEVSAVGK